MSKDIIPLVYIEESDFQNKVIDGVVKAITDKKITVTELVGKTGLAQSLVSNILNKKRFFSVYTAYKIAMALNISLDEICGLREAQSNNINMFYLLAGLIERDGDEWKVVNDVVKSNNSGEKQEEKYAIAICTNKPLFKRFIKKYSNAIKAGKIAIKCNQPEHFVEDMKKAVINEHIELLRKIENDKDGKAIEFLMGFEEP